MSDPFQTLEPGFDATEFANGLLNLAVQQRDWLASRYESNIEMLWRRSEDGWDMDRAQAVLDALGPRGPAVFAASFLIGAIAAVGEISKTKPEVLGEAKDALMAVLGPYVASGDLDPTKIASPVTYTIDESGVVKADPGQEYPGPKTEEEAE